MNDIIKISVMGSGGVGKSAMIVRFTQNIFIEKYDPTIEDLYRVKYNMNDNDYVLEILDTPGTDQFSVMRDLYIKDSEGFILVYSCLSNTTFHDMQKIYDQIISIKETKQTPIVICANKSDLTDQIVVNHNIGRDYAEQNNCKFLETSAKTMQNNNNAFGIVLRLILNKRIEDEFYLKKSNYKNKKKNKCVLL